jgi:hypothetical protein
LALACATVPLVAVRIDAQGLLIPEAIERLGADRYRGSVIRDNRLTLVFGEDDAFQRARARAVPCPTSLRPNLSWVECLVQRLAEPGGLICDPFLQPMTVFAALEFGRRFVGCSTDASGVADTRRQIGCVE